VHKQSKAGAGGGTVANAAFTLLVNLLLRFRRSMAQQSQAAVQEAAVTAHRQPEPTYQHRSETSGRVGSCEKRQYASQSPIHSRPLLQLVQSLATGVWFFCATSTRAWRPCRQLDVQQNQVHCYFAWRLLRYPRCVPGVIIVLKHTHNKHTHNKHTHTHTHTHRRTHMHAHMHAQIHTYIHTHTHTHMHEHVYNRNTYTRKNICTISRWCMDSPRQCQSTQHLKHKKENATHTCAQIHANSLHTRLILHPPSRSCHGVLRT